MERIERPREIRIKSFEMYGDFEDYFKNPKNGWKKSGIGYFKHSNTSRVNQVVLEEHSLKIWGMDSYEEGKLDKMRGGEKPKSRLTKLLEIGKGLFSLAQTNAKRTLDSK
jgi:hypothetical protein